MFSNFTHDLIYYLIQRVMLFWTVLSIFHPSASYGERINLTKLNQQKLYKLIVCKILKLCYRVNKLHIRHNEKWKTTTFNMARY